jgi:hypothetical protein
MVPLAALKKRSFLPRKCIIRGTTYRLIILCLSASALYAQRPEHPRPDFERPQWMTLNGQWDFGFDDKFGRSITVPFCWESELSGITKKGETTGW